MPRRIFQHSAIRGDIADALDYTEEKWGERKKAEYKDLIKEAVAALRENPRLARRRPDIHPEARVHQIAQPGRDAAHVLVFTITADDDVILVRFLNESRDLPRHFPSDFDKVSEPQ